MLEIFTLPFMQRAFLAGNFIAILLGWLGIFVVAKKMSFLGDGIAHASLAGVALALLLGWTPTYVAMVAAITIASIIFFVERKTNISSDAAIGIFFTSGMALGVILLNFYSGYQPELVSYLFGNILAINTTDFVLTLIVGLTLLLFLYIFSRQLTFATVDPEGAYLHGQSNWFFDYSLYIAVTIAIVLSIKLLGIVLVSALLIIPSSISGLFAQSFKSYRFFSIITTLFLVNLGLIISYIFDLPSGATIVLLGATIFILGVIISSFKK